MTPYNTTRLDLRHHTFVQTTEYTPSQASPRVKQGLWALTMVLRVIGDKGAAPLGTLREGAECMLRGMGARGKPPQLPLDFAMKPKRLLKIKS